MNKSKFKLTVIALYLQGRDIAEHLKHQGAIKIQKFEGKGTVKFSRDRKLSTDDINKSITTCICSRDQLEEIVPGLLHIFDFEKKNSGIIYAYNLDDRKDNDCGYSRILVEVPKGFSDEVILLADSIGLKGATVVEKPVGKGIYATLESEIPDTEAKDFTEGNTVEVIIIAERKKADEFISVSKNILPRMLRNRPYRLVSDDIKIVCGLTV